MSDKTDRFICPCGEIRATQRRMERHQAECPQYLLSRIAELEAKVEKLSGAVDFRMTQLETLISCAERRGPSFPSYVTNSTFSHWSGELSAYHAMAALLTPAPESGRP